MCICPAGARRFVDLHRSIFAANSSLSINVGSAEIATSTDISCPSSLSGTYDAVCSVPRGTCQKVSSAARAIADISAPQLLPEALPAANMRHDTTTCLLNATDHCADGSDDDGHGTGSDCKCGRFAENDAVPCGIDHHARSNFIRPPPNRVGLDLTGLQAA